MHAFIVRPFGTQRTRLSKKSVEIDFDRVERELIRPALDKLGIQGGTTGLIVQAGNIREDMFQLLLTADLVIADISIHNANVFYELGVRHALRDKRTFLIRGKGDDVPFDLKTDRYLEYPHDNPGSSLSELIAALRATIDDERVDSPVFLNVRNLTGVDLEPFYRVPSEFREEVRRAAAAGRVGDLGLLGDEARRFPWAVEGLRAVGTAQVDQQVFEAARITWEEVRGYNPDDVEANARLATVYQRLGDVVRSDEAVERALARPEVRGSERAELQSLLGSNAKTRWIADWKDEPAGERGASALRSPALRRACEAYAEGFASDRNHFYSGLNALALLTVLLKVAEANPDAWGEAHTTDDEGRRELLRLEEDRTKIAAATQLALEGAKRRMEFERKTDVWLELSVADLECITSSRAKRVATLYREALATGARFHAASARRQLDIYQRLGVLGENVTAALKEVDSRLSALPDTRDPALARVLLFTGHRLDAPGAVPPRFPAEAEATAREMIRAAVRAELDMVAGKAVVIGYAGGASGGDILFHEICAELGVSTQLFLAGPRDAYVVESVQDGGPAWVERFDRLFTAVSSRVLGDSHAPLELPRWLRSAPDYTIWQRNNLWMLHNALAHGAGRTTLIALWNGEKSNKPGGTADMVGVAKKRGAKVVILDAKPLARMAEAPNAERATRQASTIRTPDDTLAAPDQAPAA